MAGVVWCGVARCGVVLRGTVRCDGMGGTWRCVIVLLSRRLFEFRFRIVDQLVASRPTQATRPCLVERFL